MMKRSGKFYRKNEAEVMKALGLKQTYNSGSGWIEKEDGQNDYLICQLKSTDAESIKIHQKDIRMLEHNAIVSHKIPVFAIQFLNTGEIWLMAKPIDFVAVSEFLNLGYVKEHKIEDNIIIEEDSNAKTKIASYTVKSSGNEREKFHNERNEKYNKMRSAK